MKIGWSDFAIKQNAKGNHSTFTGKHETLIKLVKKHWKKRIPGAGRKDLTQVVIVPIEEKRLDKLFGCPWTDIKDASHLRAKVTRRRPHEDPYIEVHAVYGKQMPVKFAKVVLYSKATLLENDGRYSGDFDWEIVAILAGPWDNEPMSPLTMARNYLQKTGGTFAPYTAEQFAESIYFWSQYTKVS
jgi:hypothetical protein